MLLAKSYLPLAALLLAVAEVTSKQPKVTVYHESLCPGCINFITKQLYPTYLTLGDVFRVDMVPYGFASHTIDANGNLKFTCQHGDKECKGNKYEACALDQKKEQRVELHYLNCTISGTPYDANMVKNCAVQNNYDWATLSSCFEGTRGDKLLVEYGDRTHEANLSYVPSIVFNDVYDEHKNENAFTDFLRTVCNEIPAPKPSGCPK